MAPINNGSIIQYKIGVYLPDLPSKKSYRVKIIFCKLSVWAKNRVSKWISIYICIYMYILILKQWSFLPKNILYYQYYVL